jgi:hypothetical protein
MPGVPTLHPTIAAITLLFQWPTGMFRITTFHSLNKFFTPHWKSTNSASLQTPLILCFKSAVNSCMGIARPVWTAHTYNSSRPCSPWKALSNWAVQQALERGCKLRSDWTTLRKGGYKGVKRMAYSPRLWLMAIGWWNKINQCRKYPPQSDTNGIKHTIEKLDSWPKPVELQRFTFSEYSPISGRPLHT